MPKAASSIGKGPCSITHTFVWVQVVSLNLGLRQGYKDRYSQLNCRKKIMFVPYAYKTKDIYSVQNMYAEMKSDTRVM